MRIVNKRFRKFTQVGMYGVNLCKVAKYEAKVSCYGHKCDVDMNKDVCVNWANDPAEQGGILSKYSPAKLR